MFINKKEAQTKNISLREKLNLDIKGIARKRLTEKNLSPTARQILEKILEENTDSDHKAA